MRNGRQRQPRRLNADVSEFGLFDLEPRVLLSAFSWTPEEVYLAELVNRARANPLAEQARLNAQPGNTIDLTAGLTAGELARLVPSEPLALNAALTLAARAHSLDMAQRDFFDHNNPDGLTPTNRAQAQGYQGSAGENIAAGYQTVDAAHRAWIESVGHRKNVFSLHTNFDSTFHYDEIGPGFAFTSIGPYFDFYTQKFGVPSSPLKFILGVVYQDSNGNNFYNIGEGRGNVRIDVSPVSDPYTIVGTYTTDAAGNYQIQVPSGSYNVIFTNLANNRSYVAQATVTSVNVKVDARMAQLTTNLDDHANAGDFAGATVIDIGAQTGMGAAAGVIEHPTDSDLFRFTAAGTGEVTVRVTTAQGNLSPVLTVMTSGGNPLGVGSPVNNGLEVTLSAVEGQVYYILVAPEGAASAGPYAITVQGVVGTPPPGGGDPQNPFGASLNSTPRGTSASGLLTLTVANENGRPIIYTQQGDGSWAVIDLLARAGGHAIVGDPMVWTDPKDGLVYVSARSDQGLVLYRRGGNGNWTVRNLTAELPGAPNITGSATSFLTKDGKAAVAGLSASGDMILYHQTGAATGGNYAWTAVNLTQRDLAPQGLSTPAFVGELISYVTDWNGQHIAGLDAQGNIHAVWWAPGLSAWSVDNLSAKTGAAPIAGGLTAYLTPWSGINLAGVNADGELSVTWWVPQFQGDWANTNLTIEMDGPRVQLDSIASYVTPWGGLNIVAADAGGALVVYWWAPDLPGLLGEDRWLTTTLSDEVPDAPIPAGPMTGVSAGDTISIVGASEDGNVFRYWWQVGGAWQAQDLTAIAIAG